MSINSKLEYLKVLNDMTMSQVRRELNGDTLGNRVVNTMNSIEKELGINGEPIGLNKGGECCGEQRLAKLHTKEIVIPRHIADEILENVSESAEKLMNADTIIFNKT